jgi:RNA polymerase sigma factor (sigma-70 family)
MAAYTKTRDWSAGNRRDTELALRARAGDKAAENELYLSYYPTIYGRVQRWLWDPQWVKECTDHVMAKIFEDLPKYRPDESAFSYWANMEYRSEMGKHIHDLEIDHPNIPIDEMLEEELPAQTGPLDAYVVSRLHEEAEDLEPQQEAAIDGSYFKGKPDREIAKEKKISRRKVNYRKHQGLANLRKALSDVAFTWIRPQTGFFRNYYMMASAKQNISALLGGEEGDYS